MQNEKYMILNNVLLYKSDINGTDGVASYYTIYRFSKLFLTGKLEGKVHGEFWRCICLHICMSCHCCLTHNVCGKRQ